MAGSAFLISSIGGGGGSGGSSSSSASAQRADSLKITIDQVNTFTAGNILRLSGGSYVKAQANNSTNAEVVGIVETANSTTFTYVGYGKIDLVGVTTGTVYYLSPATAGARTTIEPATIGYVIKPVLYGIATNVGYVQNYRGMVKPAPISPFSQGTVTYVYTISTGDGSLVDFDAYTTLAMAEDITVFVDAIVQRPYLDYTVAGTIVTIIGAPVLNVEVELRTILLT